MDIVLNRRGGVPVRDQLVTQLELKILCGELGPGQRLPSVRSLARRLKLHHNTVSAAYQDLKAAGRVRVQRGSGVFVSRGVPTSVGEARGLDEMIRLALREALRKGYTGVQIRAAVERWLAAAPPERIVVAGTAREMSELLVHEVTQALGVPASACDLDDLERDPALLSAALAVALPYHMEKLRAVAPAASIQVLTLEVADEDRRAILELPAGAIVLIVSHSPAVLPVASVFLSSLRGDELLIEPRVLSATREWRRLVRAADLVFADALSSTTVRAAGARRVREFRFVTDAAAARLREALRIVVPRDGAGVAPPLRIAAGGRKGRVTARG